MSKHGQVPQGAKKPFQVKQTPVGKTPQTKKK